MNTRSMRFGAAVLLTAGLSFAPVLAAERVAPPGFAGGGGIAHEQLPHDEIPPLVRANIEHQLELSGQRLRAQGQLPEPVRNARIDGLIWPLRARPGYADFDYHGISNYVDLNPAFPNQLQDWTCGTRTYDLTSGYNHAGIDYFLWPFGWRMMDAEVIEVVAAAPGTLLHKQDGFNDRSCTNHYSADWNAVYIQHADGTVAWYGHLKNGSTTTRPTGSAIAVGEYLGLVASSGFSSGPHLHFELRGSNQAGAQIFEPHSGACRAGASLWAMQRPYWSTGINKLATHSAQPSFAVSCPNPGQETPNFRNKFEPGVDNLFLAPYYRDQLQGVAASYRLKRKGQVVSQWQHASPQTYAASWWYWNYLPVPAATARGAWIFEVEYDSRIYRHEYMVGGSDLILATSFGG